MTSCGVPSLPPGRELDSDLASLVEQNRATIEALRREKQALERVEEEKLTDVEHGEAEAEAEQAPHCISSMSSSSMITKATQPAEMSPRAPKEVRAFMRMGDGNSNKNGDADDEKGTMSEAIMAPYEEDVPTWEACPKAPLSPSAHSSESPHDGSKRKKIQCFVHSASLSSAASESSLSGEDSCTLQLSRCLSSEGKDKGNGNLCAAVGNEEEAEHHGGTRGSSRTEIRRAPKSRALDERFKCPVCVRTFLSTQAVDTHMERRHSNRVMI